MNKIFGFFIVCFFIFNNSTVLSGGTDVQAYLGSGQERITVEHNPSQTDLTAINISSWPTWHKEISEFDWQFTQEETVYVLAGEVIVSPVDGKEGEAVVIKKGDLVTFSAGLQSHWIVKQEISKHYHLKSDFPGQRFFWGVLFKVDSVLEHTKHIIEF
jgi:uncharacterized protein